VIESATKQMNSLSAFCLLLFLLSVLKIETTFFFFHTCFFLLSEKQKAENRSRSAFKALNKDHYLFFKIENHIQITGQKQA
jgi:hypothetical protein